MTLNEFDILRRSIEREKFTSDAQTTPALGLAKNEFKQSQLRRLLKVASSVVPSCEEIEGQKEKWERKLERLRQRQSFWETMQSH